jgi:hypothetical protein
MCFFHGYLQKSCPKKCLGRDAFNYDFCTSYQEVFQAFETFKSKRSIEEMEDNANKFLHFFVNDELIKRNNKVKSIPYVEMGDQLFNLTAQESETSLISRTEVQRAFRNENLKFNRNRKKREKIERLIQINAHGDTKSQFNKPMQPEITPKYQIKKRIQEDLSELPTPKKKHIENISPKRLNSIQNDSIHLLFQTTPLLVSTHQFQEFQMVVQSVSVKQWLESNSFEMYVDKFIEHGFDKLSDIIQNGLNSEDFKLLGVQKIGHIKKFHWLIEKLRKPWNWNME